MSFFASLLTSYETGRFLRHEVFIGVERRRRWRDDVFADLSSTVKEVEWAPFAVTDIVQFGVYAALGPADQAATSPFFKPILVVLRWALR